MAHLALGCVIVILCTVAFGVGVYKERHPKTNNWWFAIAIGLTCGLSHSVIFAIMLIRLPHTNRETY